MCIRDRVHAIGVVVAGGEFLHDTALLTHFFISPAGVEQQVHGVARHLVQGIILAVLVAAPGVVAVSYTHLRAHETVLDLVCRLLLEKKTRINDPERQLLPNQPQR